ncbi:MAG: hypothetical protein MI742_08905 [Desulfobacterales bacterium]|nr:hypothetical protein [Desulfobacterales bacterium]
MKTMQTCSEENIQKCAAQKRDKGVSMANTSETGVTQAKLAEMIQCSEDPLQREMGLDEEEER